MILIKCDDRVGLNSLNGSSMQLAGFSPSLSQLNQLSNALSQHPSVVAPLSPSMSAMSSSLATMSSNNVAASLYQSYQTSPSSGIGSGGHQNRNHHQAPGLPGLGGLGGDFSNRQIHPLASGVNASGGHASVASEHADKSQGLNCYNSYEHLLLNGSNYFQDCLTSHNRSSSSVVTTAAAARGHIHHTSHPHHPHQAQLMAAHVPHGNKESPSPSVYENNNLNELSPTI